MATSGNGNTQREKRASLGRPVQPVPGDVSHKGFNVSKATSEHQWRHISRILLANSVRIRPSARIESCLPICCMRWVYTWAYRRCTRSCPHQHRRIMDASRAVLAGLGPVRHVNASLFDSAMQYNTGCPACTWTICMQALRLARC